MTREQVQAYLDGARQLLETEHRSCKVRGLANALEQLSEDWLKQSEATDPIQSLTDDPRAAAFKEALTFTVMIDAAEAVNNGYFVSAQNCLIRALCAAPDADRWQPIETAPKDGTYLLVFLHGHCDVASWSNDANGSYNWNNTEYTMSPAHWMPLPAPPKEKT